MGEFRQGNRCTVQRHSGDFCDAPSAEDMPFPICGRHAAKLYRRVASQMNSLAGDHVYRAYDALEWIKQRQAEDERNFVPGNPVVYYIQLGEHIKIGHTIRLKQRMQSYPPHKRLLATEPGEMSLERERHNQFSHLLAHGREWYKVDGKLIDHINELRQAAGATPITWP